MDLVALKRDYLNQRGVDGIDSDSDIDVVGDSGAESENCNSTSGDIMYPPITEAGVDLSVSTQDDKTRRPNPFSIESLLNT